MVFIGFLIDALLVIKTSLEEFLVLRLGMLLVQKLAIFPRWKDSYSVDIYRLL